MSIKNRPDVSDLSCKIISCYNMGMGSQKTNIDNPEIKMESIKLTEYAKDLIERKGAASSPKDYTAEDILKIADKNDADIAKGKYKTWKMVLAGIGEKYGLSA